MDDFYDEALSVAKTFDISTKPDTLVLYSVSYQPTKKNKQDALAFVHSHQGYVMIDNTPCGVKMIDMGLDSEHSQLNPEEVAYLWRTASKRLIENASGNVTAFVDNADERSVFRSMELPTILANDKIITINGIAKQDFACRFKDC